MLDSARSSLFFVIESIDWCGHTLHCGTLGTNTVAVTGARSPAECTVQYNAIQTEFYSAAYSRRRAHCIDRNSVLELTVSHSSKKCFQLFFAVRSCDTV